MRKEHWKNQSFEKFLGDFQKKKKEIWVFGISSSFSFMWVNFGYFTLSRICFWLLWLFMEYCVAAILVHIRKWWVRCCCFTVSVCLLSLGSYVACTLRKCCCTCVGSLKVRYFLRVRHVSVNIFDEFEQHRLGEMKLNFRFWYWFNKYISVLISWLQIAWGWNVVVVKLWYFKATLLNIGMKTVLIFGLVWALGGFEFETGFMLSGVIFPSDTFHYCVGPNDNWEKPARVGDVGWVSGFPHGSLGSISPTSSLLSILCG